MKSARKEQCSSKLCFVVVAVIVCLLYLFVYFQASTENSASFGFSHSFDRLDAPTHLYGTCPLPRTSESLSIVEKERDCEPEKPLTLINSRGQIVSNPATNAAEKELNSCYVRPFHDSASRPWTWLRAIAVFFTRNDKLFWYKLEDADKIADDFIEVDCLGFNNVHGRVRRREEIPMRANNTPDVLIIHVRSAKSNLFTPKTTRFLEEALDAVHFYNYLSLGDDFADFGAILADGLATPLSRERMESVEVPTTLPRSFYDDPCSVARTPTFLPRILEKEGYATVIADENKYQEWNFAKGCGWEPTSQYLPLLHRFPPVAGCKFANRVLDYFQRFDDAYSDSAKLAVLRILHDDDVIDEELQQVLSSTNLQNAFVFFVADVPGSANPSPAATPTRNLWISMPERIRYTTTMAHLRSSQHELVTPFDVHATLRAIIGLPSSATGSSLLEKLPTTVRDCLHLPIPLQHCPCPVSRINYTDTGTLFDATESALEPLSKLLTKYGCKKWDIERIYSVRRFDSLPLVEIHVAVRPWERNGHGYTRRYERLDYPVFKILAEETQGASSLVFTGLPELSVALKPVDYALSPCMKDHWLRPFCYCEVWML